MDGLNSSCTKPPSVGVEAVGAPNTCMDSMGVWPRVAQVHPVRYQSRPSMTLWKTQCAQRIQSWLNACPWNVTASTEGAMELCWPWCPFWANGCLSPGSWAWAMWCRFAVPTGFLPQPVVAASSGHDGIAQGERYCSARGEILRPLPDQQRRRRSARACPSIKSESLGIEDDQTPS